MKLVYITTGVAPKMVMVKRQTRKIKRMPIHAWGEKDRDRFDEAIKPRKASEEPLASTFKKYHLRNLISSYGIALRWLQQQNCLDWNMAPAARWPDSILEAYILWLEANFPEATVKHRVTYLGLAMDVLDPQACRQRFKDAVCHRGSPKPSVRHELVTTAELVALSQELRAEGRTLLSTIGTVGARKLQAGIQMGLFALLMFREGELARLTYGLADVAEEADASGSRRSKKDQWSHLYKVRTDWRIRLRADEVKNGVARDVPVPEELVADLLLFLREGWPKLVMQLPCGTSNVQPLWVSKRGSQQLEHSIAKDLSDATMSRYDRRCTPHMVRQAGTTMIAQIAPEKLDAASSVMGNKPKVRDRHYNCATTHDASILWCEVLDELLQNSDEPDVEAGDA